MYINTQCTRTCTACQHDTMRLFKVPILLVYGGVDALCAQNGTIMTEVLNYETKDGVHQLTAICTHTPTVLSKRRGLSVFAVSNLATTGDLETTDNTLSISHHGLLDIKMI